jgi:hypothetical protein
MAEKSKTIVNEISLWKKRWSDSSKTLSDVYKGLSRDAKRAIKELRK